MTLEHAHQHTHNAQRAAHKAKGYASQERRALKGNAFVGPGGNLIYPMPPPKKKKRS